jgi:hypothetical protein
MITWHTYAGESAYNTVRYNLLYWVEETGNPSQTPYLDSQDIPAPQWV